MKTSTKQLSHGHYFTVLDAARSLYGADLPAGATAVLAQHSEPRVKQWLGIQILRADGSVFSETGREDTFNPLSGMDVNDHTVLAAVKTFCETMQCNIDANATAEKK